MENRTRIYQNNKIDELIRYTYINSIFEIR